MTDPATSSPSVGAPATTVRLPPAWYPVLAAVGAVLGVGAGFAVRPLVGLLLDLVDGAPGPLRLAAELPVPWAVAVLGVLGAVGGLWVADAWEKDNPVVTVGPQGLAVRRGDWSRHVDRARVAGVLLAEPDLVVREPSGAEPVRVKADRAVAGRLRAALGDHGYRWLGTTDPLEDRFTPWVDDAPGLAPEAHALLRDRRRALADGRAGEADAARDALTGLGVAVRDRGGAQEYRRC
ncbi:hypothetical protein [Isoptericola sp. BMS4]|uniref:YqeB family protein n=1 Tax=Isoptericola sp. BMS4 TaxID=2527875 RepID=UPI00196A6269|nr:hypothetical protein [Isoptericola sp. BMS4]